MDLGDSNFFTDKFPGRPEHYKRAREFMDALEALPTDSVITPEIPMDKLSRGALDADNVEAGSLLASAAVQAILDSSFQAMEGDKAAQTKLQMWIEGNTIEAVASAYRQIEELMTKFGAELVEDEDIVGNIREQGWNEAYHVHVNLTFK